MVTRRAHAGGDRLADGVAEGVDVVGDERVGQPERVPLLAAVDGPDQGAVGGVELGDTGFLLDDRRAVESDPALRRDDQVSAQSGGDAVATEAADFSRDHADHGGQRAQFQLWRNRSRPQR